MKKSIILGLCFSLMLSFVSINIQASEESSDVSACDSCNNNLTETEKIELEDAINEFKDYTTEEFNKVINTVESSKYYIDNRKKLNLKQPLNVYKDKENLENYYSVAYQFDYNEFPASLVFILDNLMNIKEVYYSVQTENKIVIKELVSSNTSVQQKASSDCRTLVCRKYAAANAIEVNKICTTLLGAPCNLAMTMVIKKKGPSKIICRTAKIILCSTATNKVCVNAYWFNGCEY